MHLTSRVPPLLLLLACRAPTPPTEPVEEVAKAAPAPKPTFPRSPGELLIAPTCEACSLPEQVDRALWRLGPFLAEWEGETSVDAAMAVHAIREVVDSEALSRAWERVRTTADADADHPHRRVWATMEVGPTNAWSMPSDRRPNLNKLMSEALWCDVYPLREETLAYLHGGMLDDGGYWTTHAAWALAEARARDCIEQARFETAAALILADLLPHQPASLVDPTVPELDLFAERLLAMQWLGHQGPEVEASLQVLLEHQAADGGWGEPDPEDNPYYGYHAAFMAGWALSEWRKDYSSGAP